MMLIDNILPRRRVLWTALALAAAAGAAQAQISGSLWENWTTDTAAGGPPAGAPNATFSASAINFSSTAAANGYTVGGFLASDGATGVSYSGGAAPGDDLDNTFMLLTGNIYLNAGANNFSVGHDDGLIITIPGLPGGTGNALNDPGPTGFVLTPFTITAPSAGVYSFTVDYNECCGAPAYLTWQYPSGAPVTGGAPDGGCTAGLLGLGLAALAAWRRRG